MQTEEHRVIASPDLIPARRGWVGPVVDATPDARQARCPHNWRDRPTTTPRHRATLAGRCDLEPQRIGYLALQRMLGQRAVGHVNATSRARGGRPRPSSI